MKYRFTCSSKNNTEIPYTLYLIASSGNPCKIIVQYYNQEIDIDVIYNLTQIFRFYMYSCMWACAYVFSSMQFYHMQVCVSTATGEIQNTCIITRILHVSLFFLQLYLPPHPNLQQPLIYLFSMSMMLLFQECYITGIK